MAFDPLNPLNLTPAILPPPGQVSNFVHPDTLLRWTVLCMTVCLIFATVPFALRCYVRRFLRREWVFEDCVTCLGYAAFVTYCALSTTLMDRHGGVHGWDLTAPDVVEAFYWFNVATIGYGIAMGTVKFAILIFYRRVFVALRGSIFDISIYVLQGIIVAFYTAITLVKIFECQPHDRIWDRTIPGTCVDIGWLLNSSGTFNLLTDLIILLIPIKTLWSLRMRRKKKAMIMAAFTVGSIAPIFSTIGMIARFELFSNPDATYYQPQILLWAAAEVCTALIALCLPPLSILLRRPLPGQAQSGQSPYGLSVNSTPESALNPSSPGRRATTPHSADQELLSMDFSRPKSPLTISTPPGAHISCSGRPQVRVYAHTIPTTSYDAWTHDRCGDGVGTHRNGQALGADEHSGTRIVRTVRNEESNV